jgi:adenine phosphoribosyltransferase
VTVDTDRLKAAIRDVPDFPKPGILFKDITPILADPTLFREALDRLADPWAKERVDVVAGIEARGFILGGALADRLGAGFVPVRKVGKLPWKTESVSYDLEYGTGSLEIHVDGVRRGQRVLLVDDLLATGGTAAAAVRLLRTSGAEVLGISFLVNLAFLKGADKLSGIPLRWLVEFD